MPKILGNVLSMCVGGRTIVSLDQYRKHLSKNENIWHWSEPFVYNDRGWLTHRPRAVSTYLPLGKIPSHVAVHFWCGNSVSTNRANLSFQQEPPHGGLVCPGCERKAREAGLPSAEDLVGGPVSYGRLRPTKTAAPEDWTKNPYETE